MKKTSNPSSFLHLLVSWVGTGYVYLVGKTSFVQKWDDPEYLEIRRRKKKAVYACWHRNQAFVVYAHRGEKANILVSRSKDGEYIARVLAKMGFETVRGSSSKGGTSALREMIDLVNQGKQVAFTPDGPKGPLQTVHGGVVRAAKISGAPVIPLAVTSRRRLVFNSWDKFVLPLPFSRVVLAHGKPFLLSNDVSDEEATERVRSSLNAIGNLADKIERESSSWWSCFLGKGLKGIYSLFGFASLPLWVPIFILKYGWTRSKSGFVDRLGFGHIPKSHRSRLWFHAASIGEAQALRPLLEKFKQLQQYEIFVTVSTPEAKKFLTHEEPEISTSLLPMDLPFLISRWIEKINPFATFVVETELWPNMIYSLYERNTPVFVVNGRLSERSTKRWKMLKPMIQNMMRSISLFYVRSDLDARRFCELGAPYENVQVIGNLKSDNLQISEEFGKGDLREGRFGFRDGLVLIAGSTRVGEEKMLLDVIQQIKDSSLRLILAPRRLSRTKEVSKLLKMVPRTYSLWSQVKKTHKWTTEILLVDTLGDLKNLYGLADLAFVGGTFPKGGGQNPFEPASMRLPVLFGPSMENFHEEAIEMKKVGAAREVRNEKDLLDDIQSLLKDDILRKSMGDAGANLVRSKQGVAEKTFIDIRQQLGI